MGTGRSRSIIIFCPDVRTRDITLTTANYIRDLRWTKWASGVSLHGSNPEPLMSALGQKRTSRYLHLMSALPPKVDIGTQLHDVRFVPKADICSAAIYDLLEQVLTYFCQQVARAVRLRHVVITSRCSRYMFFPIQRM